MASTEGTDFQTKITAEPSGFISAFDQAAKAAQAHSRGIEQSVGMIGDAFKKILGPLQVVGALFAGGKFFGEAIGQANKLNGETMGLAKALGITGNEASVLRTALDDIYSDSDTYIGAFQKFAKQLKNNEDGLQAMGLKTRDANGNLRDSNTLFTEALHVVGDYKPGLDQTTAAMTLFGKGVNEVMALQKLNNKVLEDAKEKNEDLGLTISKEGVEATKKYKAAMNDVGDVFVGIKNVIGQAVMPIFTELGNWFAGIGPAAVTTFRYAIGGVALAFDGLLLGVKIVVNSLRALVDPLVTFGGAVQKLLSGDINGATRDMQALPAKWSAAWSAAFQKIATDSAATNAQMDRLFNRGTDVAAPGTGTKTMGDFKKPDKDKTRMGAWEAELSDLKLGIEQKALAEGQYREMTKAEEAKFWDERLALTNLSQQELESLTRKSNETKLAGIKQNFDVQVASLQAEAAAFKSNTDERMRLQLLVQSKYAEGTKEYADAQKRIVEIQRQAADQERQIQQTRIQADRDARLQVIALEEQSLQTSVQLGLVSQAELLQMQVQFEAQRNAIAAEALQARLLAAQADPDRNPVEIEKIYSEIEQLELQHQLRVSQIRGAMAIEAKKNQDMFFDGMQQKLSTSIQSILTGTQNLSQSFKTLFRSLGQTLAQVVAKMAADWVIAQLTMRTASKQTALAQLQNSAVAAAGAAYDAIVGIPYVGPFLAPVAAAVAYAGVMAFGASASAEGGYDIPGNVNPLVQTHAREMILPAKHADVIRSLADGEGGGARGGDTHLHVHAVDAQSVARLFHQNGAALSAVMKQQVRNGAFAS